MNVEKKNIAIIGVGCHAGLIKRLMESKLKEVIVVNPKLKEISSKDLNPKYSKLINENWENLI